MIKRKKSQAERTFLRMLGQSLAMYENAPSYWRKEFRAMQPGEYRKILKLRKSRFVK